MHYPAFTLEFAREYLNKRKSILKIQSQAMHFKGLTVAKGIEVKIIFVRLRTKRL